MYNWGLFLGAQVVGITLITSLTDRTTHGPKPYTVIRLGDIHGPKPYKITGLGDTQNSFGESNRKWSRNGIIIGFLG